MLKSVKKKYRSILQHIRYKGLPVFIKSKIYDHYQQYQLVKPGIVHLPGTGDVSI
ncbi:MAG: hypothetical protein JST81_14125 [Bacteroidetes bacterium]|nr:hypothetical protein [Bacteroidota bacterium]